MGVGECVQGLCEEGYRKRALKEKCKYDDGKEEGETKIEQQKRQGKNENGIKYSQQMGSKNNDKILYLNEIREGKNMGRKHVV